MNNYKLAEVLRTCDECEKNVDYCDFCGADYGLGGKIYCDRKRDLQVCCNCNKSEIEIEKTLAKKIQVGKCYNCLPKTGGNYKNMLCIVRKLSEDMFKVLQIKGDTRGNKYGYEIYYSTYHKENLPHKLAQEVSLEEFAKLYGKVVDSLKQETGVMAEQYLLKM